MALYIVVDVYRFTARAEVVGPVFMFSNYENGLLGSWIDIVIKQGNVQCFLIPIQTAKIYTYLSLRSSLRSTGSKIRPSLYCQTKQVGRSCIAVPFSLQQTPSRSGNKAEAQRE